MQRGEHDQVARPLFEHGIEIPDFEMAAHADQQRTLARAAACAHPRGDPDPPLAVHLRGRDEPEPPPEQRIACATFPAPFEFLMMIDDAQAIIDQHAGIVRVKADEQVFPRTARLYRYAELFGKNEFATRADGRNRTSYEEFFHCACTTNNNRTTNTIQVRYHDDICAPRLCRPACYAALTVCVNQDRVSQRD